jgi:hypothetical protein
MEPWQAATDGAVARTASGADVDPRPHALEEEEERRAFRLPADPECVGRRAECLQRRAGQDGRRAAPVAVPSLLDGRERAHAAARTARRGRRPDAELPLPTHEVATGGEGADSWR